MLKFFYSQHDLRADFFNAPMVSDKDPESFAVEITRSIKLCRDPKQLELLADCKLCSLGFFDDETGLISAKEPVIIVHCDELIKSLGPICPKN